MSGDTTKIRLGTCNIYFGGDTPADRLGLTIGGVEVEVTTETQKTMVDQYGDTTVKETIRGRNLVVRTQLAESTVDNMVKLMPGATLLSTGGSRAVVSTGIGIDLRDLAKQLILRPINLDDDTNPDKTEDFTIPLCSTPGGLNFAYSKDNERVFDTEFNAYPTPDGTLYEYGDPAASA